MNSWLVPPTICRTQANNTSGGPHTVCLLVLVIYDVSKAWGLWNGSKNRFVIKN